MTNGKLGFEYQLQFCTMLTYSGESSGGKQSVNGDEDPGVVIVVIMAYKNLWVGGSGKFFPGPSGNP